MKSVAVLLSTYNGDNYIKEQIESVLQQINVNLRLFVRDDGSSDNTRKIINEIAQTDSRISIYLGSNIGYTQSFFELCKIAENTSDYYAFCDQDDVWKPNKLISALEQLDQKKNGYKLYFSGLTFVDKDLSKIKEKKYSLQDINFGHAMVRNSVAGCSMVFSNDLNSLCTKSKHLGILTGHDAWLYRLNLAIGGATVYDNQSYILFRRYGENTTDSGTITPHRILEELNLKRAVSLRFDTAKIIEEDYNGYISAENRCLIKKIVNYKKSALAKFRLLTSDQLKYSFFPVVVMCKLQIIFNKY